MLGVDRKKAIDSEASKL